MLGPEENLESYTITLEEDEEGNLILPFPDDLLDALGWGEDDVLEIDAIAGQISSAKWKTECELLLKSKYRIDDL